MQQNVDLKTETATLSRRLGKTAAIGWLIALSILYFFAELVPGRFPVTDEAFYKAAGRNWAATGKFAAPEIIGKLTEGPPLTEIFFAQPPLYSFFFGVWTKLVGFSPRTCVAYDALIHILLMWSIFAAALAAFRLPWSWAALCGALVLPLGTAGRSDELAIVFALWAAVAFTSDGSRMRNAMLGGIFLGLCVSASLSALAFLGPFIALEFLNAPQDELARRKKMLVAVAGCAATAIVCVAPILIHHPTAYQQLINHVGIQPGILTLLTSNTFAGPEGFSGIWLGALRYGARYAVITLGLFAFAIMCLWSDHTRERIDVRRVLLAGLLLAFLIAALPGKYMYSWYLGVWLLLICGGLAEKIWRTRPSKTRLLLALGACIWLVSAAPYFQQKLILWTLPADQSLSVNTERVRTEIPTGKGVMTTEYWWALADRDRVYDIMFSRPNPQDVDYIVVSGNGSGKPGTPVNVSTKSEGGQFREVYDHLNRTPSSIFGIRFSRSAYGFGAYILQRTQGD